MGVQDIRGNFQWGEHIEIWGIREILPIRNWDVARSGIVLSTGISEIIIAVLQTGEMVVKVRQRTIQTGRESGKEIENCNGNPNSNEN